MFKRFVRFVFVVGLFASISLIFSAGAYAAPATFTVINTNDAGAGSLRQAIIDANSNGNAVDMDVIEFDISGSEVHTITLASALPVITQKVTIDGYSQTGAQQNTAVAPMPLNSSIKVEVNLDAITSDALTVTADETVVKGLALFSSTPKTSYITFNANNVVFSGNFVGLRADGLTRVDNEGTDGVTLIAFGDGYSGCQLGGLNPEDRNVIATLSKSVSTGSIVIGGDDCIVRGNYIGLAKDGVTDVGGDLDYNNMFEAANGIVSGSNTGLIVGGSQSGAINVLSGTSLSQLSIGGSDGYVQGNYFGTDYTGSVNSGISNGAGITAGTGNLIGGTSPGEGNVFAGLSGAAVAINSVKILEFGLDVIPAKNAVLGNSIKDVRVFDYVGFGTSNLGLDLFRQENNLPTFDGTFEFLDRGPNTNDAGDGDTGPNGFINTPILKTAQQIGTDLTITYDLDAADSPSSTYRVEFFASNESSIFGFGPGETYLGSATVAPGTNKTVTLTVSGDQTNKALSATTTAVDGTTASGFGATSEFARNISIGSATDFDSDGAADTMEDLAPNDGDANNDGIADKLQPTVTSFEIDSTGIYKTLVTDGCSENGTVASVDVSSLAKGDNGKVYPFGLTDFALNCSRGDTVTVTKYVFTEDRPTSYVLRKFNPNTEEYFDVPGSTIVSQQVGEVTALVSTYAITDGGDLDDDGQANGIIVDPVGLATTESLADTGQSQRILLVLMSIFLMVGFTALIKRRNFGKYQA